MLYNIIYKDNIYKLELNEYSSILNIKYLLKNKFNINDIDFYLSNNIINFDNNKLLKIYNTDKIYINPKIKGGRNSKLTVLYILFIIFIIIISILIISVGFIPLIYILLNLFFNLFKTFVGNNLVCHYNKISLYKFIKFFINILLFFLLIIILYCTIMFSVLLLILLVKKKVFYEQFDKKYYNVANISTIILVVIFMLIYIVYRSDRIFLNRSRKIFGNFKITKYTILLLIEGICKGIYYLKGTHNVEQPIQNMKKYMDEIIKFTVVKENRNQNNSENIIDFADDEIDCLDTYKSLYIVHKGCSDQFFEMITKQFEKVSKTIKEKLSENKQYDENVYKNNFNMKDMRLSDIQNMKLTDIKDIKLENVNQFVEMAELLKDRDALVFLMNVLNKNKYNEMKKSFDNSMIISKLYGTNVDYILGMMLKYILCNSLRFIINTDTIITEYGDLYDNIDILLSGFKASTKTGVLYFILLIILTILGLLNVY